MKLTVLVSAAKLYKGLSVIRRRNVSKDVFCDNVHGLSEFLLKKVCGDMCPGLAVGVCGFLPCYGYYLGGVPERAVNVEYKITHAQDFNTKVKVK